jgi:tryptophan halogenase
MKIAIVGGGTAGWMSAAYLSRNLPNSEVVVIDKEVGNSIGVGEGTILDFFDFMQQCRFNFEDWFVNIDATFKAGIRFTNWQKEGSDIWHPFFTAVRYSDYNCNIWEFLAYRNDLDYKDYACMMHDSAVKHNKVDYSDAGLYAFHVDAGKLVTYIQERLKEEIKIIKKEVVQVNRGDNNEITSLGLIDGTLIKADLYIDCTGFASLLKKQKIVDVSDRLFCDTAVAGRIPYEDIDTETRPYVICDAVEHGWIWRIPVKGRLGSGLVFNRSVTDPEDAKDYLVKYWNGRLNRDNVKVIDWTPFYIENAWETNVVSIGLTAGFVEPLESTGISLIIKGLQTLEQRLRISFYTDSDIQLYNSMMKNYFENVIDFVNMHYSDSTNNGPFWEYVRDKFKPSDKQLFIQAIMQNARYRNTMTNKFEPNTYTMFSLTSWICLMNQYGYKFDSDPEFHLARIADRELKKFYEIEQARKLKSIPHLDLIEFFHSGKTR